MCTMLSLPLQLSAYTEERTVLTSELDCGPRLHARRAEQKKKSGV